MKLKVHSQAMMVPAKIATNTIRGVVNRYRVIITTVIPIGEAPREGKICPEDSSNSQMELLRKRKKMT